jgi:hypothetical protein
LNIDAVTEADELLRTARRRLRDKQELTPDSRRHIKTLTDNLARLRRLGPFAFANETVTLEELAEHLKRIRNDYCAGSLRDTLNRFVPQPAGPRRAYIRVPEPIALHRFAGSASDALELLRGRMQEALDAINAKLEAAGGLRHYPNPFHGVRLQQVAAKVAG